MGYILITVAVDDDGLSQGLSLYSDHYLPTVTGHGPPAR